MKVFPEGFGASPADLSDIMNPKGEPAIFNRLGGDVEAIAKLLGTNLSSGLSGNPEDLARRMQTFGGNFFAEKKLPSYLGLIWDGLHDGTIQLLIACALIALILDLSIPDTEVHAVPSWVEPLAILVTVGIVLNITAAIDYQKEVLFLSLNRELEKTNKRLAIRGGSMVEVVDREIVVGDIIVFNNVLQSSLPADGLLITGSDVKMDQGSLTGEPEPCPKGRAFVSEHDNPLMFSGTEVKSGSGTMLVIAVGALSFSGKIRAQVYGATEEDEPSPLFKKLDALAILIGKMGASVALVCFCLMCALGFGIDKKPFGDYILDYLITSITILVVAVPEGLPLAVTLSLAFSSFQMSRENNLVKKLEACETMGSATTICTDKTGTLTANQMTVRAFWSAASGLVRVSSATETLATSLKKSVTEQVLELIGLGVCINTMDESSFRDENGLTKFSGQPTECALLVFANDIGFHFNKIRTSVPGRSEATRGEGKKFDYSSARKMMSWAVRHKDGYRIYSKGGGDVLLPRCSYAFTNEGAKQITKDNLSAAEDTISQFASEAMRTIALAYKDVPEANWGARSTTQLQPDGSPAFEAECDLVLIGVFGIEDPLRDEVPPAIAKCFTAGIDVRMVTGDNLETAIAIAAQCGILRAEHFDGDFKEARTRKIKPLRAMTGEDFRNKTSVVVDETDPVTGIVTQSRTVSQGEFDKVWPYLRVMARCDPSDKKLLADGLNKSLLFQDKAKVAQFLKEEGIVIFPDRQVIAMTGDGTNDAPALRRADVGFAMGIAGTPTAKDAADIILLDDNFASIVIAAKRGRNVYDSIQKFLQFQLTVNIGALVLCTVGAAYSQRAPFSATQLLWLNMLMDSLASLALATEPPSDRQLERPPVNRTSSIITKRMWYNMLFQAGYQIIVILLIMFIGQGIPGVKAELDAEGVHDGQEYYEETHAYSKQYTIVFNAYVYMQLFNEINSRKLEGELNPFSGISQNKYFGGIWASTVILQAVFASVGGAAVGCSTTGLDVIQWFVCLGIGASVLPVQFVGNLIAASIPGFPEYLNPHK